MATRFLLGALNGLLGPIKVLIGVFVDNIPSSKQSSGKYFFSFVCLAHFHDFSFFKFFMCQSLNLICWFMPQ